VEEVSLSSKHLQVKISPARGAELVSIVRRSSGEEILWRRSQHFAPRPGVSKLGGKSSYEFYDAYRGGVQELFPNTGEACCVHGAPLLFHGESCRIPWRVAIDQQKSFATARCSTSLQRYPFDLERVVSLPSDSSLMRFESKVTNRSNQILPVSWGFHPVFGAALTRGPTELLMSVSELRSRDGGFGAANAFNPGESIDLPSAGEPASNTSALLLQEPNSRTADLLFARCIEGWYSLRNQSTGLTVSMSWNVDTLPHLWIWQECHDQSGYPWWGEHHIVGVEPQSSPHARGLAQSVEDGTAIEIGPGESRSIQVLLHIGVTKSADEAIDQARALWIAGQESDKKLSPQRGNHDFQE
jgi:galactose mutarotase-like enzyme